MKIFSFFIIIFFAFTVRAQTFERTFPLAENSSVNITNLFGRVSVQVRENEENTADNNGVILTGGSFRDGDLKINAANNRLDILVQPADQKTRIDLNLTIPARAKLKIETGEGEILISGNVASADAKSGTGTIAADVPLDDLRYDFLWTASRPRFLSDAELEKVKEKAAGRFSVSGRLGETAKKEKRKNKKASEQSEEDEADGEDGDESSATSNQKAAKNKKSKPQNQESKTVKLNFTTARGIILLNVNPDEVPADLRERPLTEAAKAIIRSGDSFLMEAIRRASPKYFGEYAATLPPRKALPSLTQAERTQNTVNSHIKKVLVSVTDSNNRAISDLRKEDFEILESGENREILSVEPASAPFNLVLLLDISGSVENYVDFIRKAARNFVNTVDRNDRLAIVIFNEDVKTLATFTTDKGRLSESLDTFDAGGGTGYYDALAYTLTETLRPLKGERTAVVVLSDGDDNRSFLPFNALLGSIQESGALIYPLYMPSGLAAASSTNNPNAAIDPLRARYMALTSKAEGEGEQLAKVSGGVFYPIRQISELQKAYDDISMQLRTAYTITFRSDRVETTATRAVPRLRVRVKRENSFVKIGSIVEAEAKEVSVLTKDDLPQSEGNQLQKISFEDNYSEYKSFFAGSAPAGEFFFQPAGYSTSKYQTAEISGEVEKINYTQLVNDKLREYKLENFDINQSTGAFVLAGDNEKIAVSRWISPKRTRSYPYERVYDTLAFSGKKVAVIPVVKDEGLGGQRDFLQWDTISLLSLLDVHVVLAYYNEAGKNARRHDQITKQKFDNIYILSRLNEIFSFKGTARHWNEREAKELKPVLEKARLAYREISKNTKTYLHDESALNELINFAETPQKFIEFSRSKAQKAQSREFQTLQPREALSTDTKGKVTISNALFGKYFFTVDETITEPKFVHLIEAKHSQRAKFPSRNDIKDGLIKMMLYTNLQNVKLGTKPIGHKVAIRLTSAKLKGSITSDVKDEELEKFCSDNLIDFASREFFKKLFAEARANKFTIILEHGETAK